MRMYLETTKDISYRRTKNSQVRVHSVLQNGAFLFVFWHIWLLTQIVYFDFQNRLEDKLSRRSFLLERLWMCWANCSPLIACPEDGGLQGRGKERWHFPWAGRNRAEVRPPGPRLINSGAPCIQPRLSLPPHTLWGLEVQEDENSSRF